MQASEYVKNLYFFKAIMSAFSEFSDTVSIENDDGDLCVSLSTPGREVEAVMTMETGESWHSEGPRLISWSRWYGLLESLGEADIQMDFKDNTLAWKNTGDRQKGSLTLLGSGASKDDEDKKWNFLFQMTPELRSAFSFLKSAVNFKTFSPCHGVIVGIVENPSGSGLQVRMYATDSLVLGKASVGLFMEGLMITPEPILIPPFLVSLLCDEKAEGGTLFIADDGKSLQFEVGNFRVVAGLKPTPSVDFESEINDVTGNLSDDRFIPIHPNLMSAVKRVRLIGSSDESTVSLIQDGSKHEFVLDYRSTFGELHEEFPSESIMENGKIRMRVKELTTAVSVGSEYLSLKDDSRVFCSRQIDTEKNLEFVFLCGGAGA